MNCLTTTRTVRKRLDFEKPVSRQIIQDCLDLALQAPNGSNLQQWRWLVVDDPERIGRLAALYNEAIAEYSKQYIEEGFSKAPGVDPAFDRMNESVAYLAGKPSPIARPRDSLHARPNGERGNLRPGEPMGLAATRDLEFHACLT